MKIVHFAQFSPRACGLFHTTKDLVKAERGVGIDAQFCDINDKIENKGGLKDGWLETVTAESAADADILVRHTAIPNDLENRGIPIVMALHGRPESSMKIDEFRDNKVVEAMGNKGRDARYKAFFTFWAEHLPFWKMIIPEHKVHLVPAMVDLMEWRPGGEKFDLGEHNGNPNILICDVWRDDVTPFDAVMEVAAFIENHCPAAKLHIAAAPTGKGANVLWRALRKRGILGYACGQTKHIAKLYAAADVVVTPHRIATRVVREGRATGTPVRHPEDLLKWWDSYQKNPATTSTIERQIAEKHYNLHNAGVAAKKIFEGIVNEKPAGCKVLFDIGGHLGETVRRFYREVNDARFWEIHSFEPHPECFKKLKANVGDIKNVQVYRDAITGTTGQKRLYLGATNDGEGSTLLTGKKTGQVDYNNSVHANGYVLQNLAVAYLRPAPPEGQYAVLKMNIEGGEYELIEHILDKDLLGYFNEIYIQTHAEKLDITKRNHYRQLEAALRVACVTANVKLFMQDKGMARFECSAS